MSTSMYGLRNIAPAVLRWVSSRKSSTLPITTGQVVAVQIQSSGATKNAPRANAT